MAKGEIAHHKQFHLWQQCFQKSSADIASKCVCRWETVNLLYLRHLNAGNLHIVTSKFCLPSMFFVTLRYLYSFPSYRRFLRPLQQITFENFVTKEEIVQNEQFLLTQCFSHLFSNYTYIYIAFLYDCLDTFKVICRIGVFVK